MARFAQNPFSPPAIKECQAEVGEDVYQTLVELGRLAPVSPEVVFRKEDYEQMIAMVREHFANEPTLTVIQFRDRLNTSRRYVLAFLEHLDTTGLTVRDGDVRRLRVGR
jgi:selenocysteine-specific elongation factor